MLSKVTSGFPRLPAASTSSYGVVVLANGAQERVVFTDERERGVLRTMAETRPDPRHRKSNRAMVVARKVLGSRLPHHVLGY